MHTSRLTQEHRPVLVSSHWQCWPSSWRGARRWPWRAGPGSALPSPPCDVEWSHHLAQTRTQTRFRHNMVLPASNWASDEDGWVHTFEELDIGGEGTAEVIGAHLQHSGNCPDVTEDMKSIQGRRQRSIKIAAYQRCEDVSTDDTHETALCPDKETTLPAHGHEPRDGSSVLHRSAELAEISHRWISEQNPLTSNGGDNNPESHRWHRQPWHYISKTTEGSFPFRSWCHLFTVSLMSEVTGTHRWVV